MTATAFPTPAVPAPNRFPALLVGAAAAWGIVLPVLAATVPIVSVQQSPVIATAVPTVSAPTAPGTVLAPDTGSALVFHAVPRVTLVAYNGHGVLLLAALPLLVALAVGLLLWLRAKGSAVAGVVAWALSVMLLAAAVAGTVTFLIGIPVLPSGVLLVMACAQTSPGAARQGFHDPGASHL